MNLPNTFRTDLELNLGMLQLHQWLSSSREFTLLFGRKLPEKPLLGPLSTEQIEPKDNQLVSADLILELAIFAWSVVTALSLMKAPGATLPRMSSCHMSPRVSQRVAFCLRTQPVCHCVCGLVTGSLNKHGLCDTESHRQSQKWYGSSVIWCVFFYRLWQAPKLFSKNTADPIN